MAEINVVGVKLGRTINLGNYESARVDVEATALVALDENLDAAFDKMWKEMDKQLSAKCAKEGWKLT